MTPSPSHNEIKLSVLSCKTLFGNNLFLLLSFQALLDSATCVVISKSAKLVDKSLEKIVGFLAIVSPTMIITSSQILSDTLFLLFFSITLYYFLFTFYKKSFFSLFSAGLMLGLSTLIRAATYPLIFLTLPVAYILNFRWANKKKILFQKHRICACIPRGKDFHPVPIRVVREHSRKCIDNIHQC